MKRKYWPIRRRKKNVTRSSYWIHRYVNSSGKIVCSYWIHRYVNSIGKIVNSALAREIDQAE
jgi:hypothetical protein